MTKKKYNIALTEGEALQREAAELGISLTPYLNQLLSKRHQIKKIDLILADLEALQKQIDRLELALLRRGLDSKPD